MRIIKKGLICLLVLLLGCMPALASGYDDWWSADVSLQWGDDFSCMYLINQALYDQGYCNDASATYRYDDVTTQAVVNFQYAWNLPQTGMLDPDTLHALLTGKWITRREAVTVWIPITGGSCYHDSAYCSGMILPRLVYETDAVWLGYRPCGKCCF